MRIAPDFSGHSVASAKLVRDQGVSHSVFAVGSLAKGSFELIVLDIQL